MLALYLAMIDSSEEKTKFSQVYEKYRNLMFYVANEILNDRYLAEDAVQNAFLRIAKNIGKIDEVESPATKRFVTIVVENSAKAMYAKERSDAYDDEFFDNVSYENSEDIVFANVSVNELVEKILKLPGTQRKIMYLYEVYGYKYSEIANLLDMKEGAVRKQAQRAREAIEEWQND